MDGIYQPIQEDSDTGLECGNCDAQIPTKAIVCPRYGVQLYEDSVRFAVGERQKKILAASVSQAQRPPARGQSSQSVQQVVAVDFAIPFASLVGLLVKVALASIPALLILGMIAGFLAVVFGGVLVSFIGQF
jgi:predicted amidophosphoribosyltransferase